MKTQFVLGNRILVGMISLLTSAQPSFALSRAPASLAASPLLQDEILQASSSGALKLTKGRLIIDNDAAFEQKIAIINAAKNAGSKASLYLTYYIYSDDYSSSKFNLALIEAAKAGVKVKLIVDLLTNYSHLDLYRFLESQGAGNLEVKFYNKPSAQIQSDAYYLTIPCSHENQVSADKGKCEAEKREIVKKGNFTPQQQLMQKLYLASYYSKNGTGLKVATVGAQEIDIAHAKQVMEADKSKKSDFKDLAKAGHDAKDSSNVFSLLSVKSMMDNLVNEIDPTLNLMTGFLPTNEIQKEHKQDWDHITDYTHQKLILADLGNGKYLFQLGGRNIEDSYHLKVEQLKKLKSGEEKQKYLFMDTDFYGEVASGGEGIKQAFLRNWNFNEMVASTQEMDVLAPIDLALGVSKCDSKSDKFNECVGAFFASLQTNPGALKEEAGKRVMTVAQNTMARAAKFETNYVQETNKAGQKHLISIRGLDKSDELSQNDLNTALVSYIENLNTKKEGDAKRTFGAETGKEMDSGKYISYLWQRGMESACASNEKTQVILHSAYLLPSASLMKTLGKMVDGTWDCHNVTIKIISNAFNTTDLDIINIFARAQMQALFNKYITGYSAKSALFSYYEYNKESLMVGQQTQSLHTKLSLLGNDLIDGSANADVRSYYMDANNGVYLHNVKELSADYQNYVDELIRSGKIVEKSSTFGDYSASEQNWKLKDYMPDVVKMTEEFINKWIARSKNNTPDQVKAKHAAAIDFAKKYIIGEAKKAFETNSVMLTPDTFTPEAKTIKDKCGYEPHDDGYGGSTGSAYPNCVEKVKKAGALNVDNVFNLEFETY